MVVPGAQAERHAYAAAGTAGRAPSVIGAATRPASRVAGGRALPCEAAAALRRVGTAS